jgi:hypothetical protein
MKARHRPTEVDVEFAPFAGAVLVGDKLVPLVTGDAIITNSRGEKYPIRKDLFDELYEIIEE